MTLQLEEARAQFINELRGETAAEIVEQVKHVMLDVLDFIPDYTTAQRFEAAIHILERFGSDSEFDDMGDDPDVGKKPNLPF